MLRSAAVTVFEAVGGEEPIRRLVHRFYEEVAEDPVLRAMYPEEDLGPAEERMALFFIQFWGGPRSYSERRGHPRLRLRHAPFRIDRAAHDTWLRHMRTAVDSLHLPPDLDQRMWDSLTTPAAAMINTPEQPSPSS